MAFFSHTLNPRGRDGIVRCWEHDIPAFKGVSQTAKNPGRTADHFSLGITSKSYTCAKDRENPSRCKFFIWADLIPENENSIPGPLSSPTLQPTQLPMVPRTPSKALTEEQRARRLANIVAGTNSRTSPPSNNHARSSLPPSSPIPPLSSPARYTNNSYRTHAASPSRTLTSASQVNGAATGRHAHMTLSDDEYVDVGAHVDEEVVDTGFNEAATASIASSSRQNMITPPPSARRGRVLDLRSATMDEDDGENGGEMHTSMPGSFDASPHNGMLPSFYASTSGSRQREHAQTTPSQWDSTRYGATSSNLDDAISSRAIRPIIDQLSSMEEYVKTLERVVEARDRTIRAKSDRNRSLERRIAELEDELQLAYQRH